MNHDLTVGKPQSVLWRFCLPLFGSVIFQQLYNLADSFVAGKFISENALAAVGNSYEITLIFIAFAFGCNIGSSVVVSRLFGAHENNRMKTAVYTSMIASAVICLFLMAFGILSCDKLLEMMKTPEIVMADSKLYLEIYLWGLPFLFFYNIATGIFSALGDSKTPFWFLAISSTSNIGMDILFVKAFDMGVAGVAWATFLCQGASCIAAMVVMLHRVASVHSTGKVALFNTNLLKQFIVIAIPSILQQSFISVGNILLQTMINGYGPGVMAGYSAAVKLNNLIITSFTTLGNGMSNYTSQNYGAKKMERIPQGLKAGVRMVWIICLPVLALYFIKGDLLLRIFLDHPSADALSSGVWYLRVLSPFYFVVSLKLITDGVLRGAGKMAKFMVSTCSDLFLRVALAALFSITFHMGWIGIWWAWPVGWFIGTVLSFIFYWKDFHIKAAA